MTKSIFGVLTIALAAAACGGGQTAEPAAQAAAAPAAEDAAAAAPAVVAPAPDPAPAPAPARAAAAPARQAPRPAPAPQAAAAPSAAPRSAAAPVPEYREFTLPTGTAMSLELKSAVASDASQVEDTVRATLRQPLTVNGREVLPAGTEFAGTVIEAERAGRVKGRARVAFRFTSLRFDGERIAVQTEPIAQEAEATKGEDATKIAVGAGAGAAIGAILGGASGAAKGAAIGGAAGTGTVMATRGKEVRLEPGIELSTRLEAPLAIRIQLR